MQLRSIPSGFTVYVRPWGRLSCMSLEGGGVVVSDLGTGRLRACSVNALTRHTAWPVVPVVLLSLAFRHPPNLMPLPKEKSKNRVGILQWWGPETISTFRLGFCPELIQGLEFVHMWFLC